MTELRLPSYRAVYTLLVLNFFLPAVSNVVAPQLTYQTLDQVNRLLGGGAYPVVESGHLWHMLGSDPGRAVVDPRFAVFDTERHFVADASVLPGTLGVNPQGTIMAMARGATPAQGRMKYLPRPMTEKLQVKGLEGLRALLGRKLGPTAWRAVTQQDVDAFARLTGDRQWIHVDVERAALESPFGTTIAHGNLTLSLIDGFRDELLESTGFALGINYGWNKVRFAAPVPTGSRVRGHAEVVSLDDVGDGWWQVVQRWTVEREGADKPACAADSVGRVLVRL